MTRFVTVPRLLALAAACCAVIVAAVALTARPSATAGRGTTTVQAGRGFTYDGRDLHWNVAAWAGDCITVHFDVYYSDGQSPNWTTFQPCSPTHALPDQPTSSGCVTETWSVYVAATVEQHPAAPLAGGALTYCRDLARA